MDFFLNIDNFMENGVFREVEIILSFLLEGKFNGSF